MLKKGDRVQIPKGPGVVNYVILGSAHLAGLPPKVNVILDRERDKPNYTGTLFPVADVVAQ